MSSNAVHAPRWLTKYDRMTYPGMNDLGTISPCTKPAILCVEVPTVVFVEFDMAAALLLEGRLRKVVTETSCDDSQALKKLLKGTTLFLNFKVAYARDSGLPKNGFDPSTGRVGVGP
jgi:hypothetical protein